MRAVDMQRPHFVTSAIDDGHDGVARALEFGRLYGAASCGAAKRAIVVEASRRRILFDRGGSFGFRGHRFELIKPETDTSPFLHSAREAAGLATAS